MKYNLIFTLIYLCFLSTGQAQQDFNHYHTLISHGTVPEDISVSTEDKIKKAIAQDRPELENKYKKAFYYSIYTSIDQILQSDMCTFGDDVSNYVSDVAKKVLFDDLTTFNELRFYTLKTNETNAFSTDQGIIFVTTGLISQITSEAQLAFVLAHEIAHYKRKHVLNRFKQHVKQKFTSIYEMSSYSKENELEADADGLKMYKKAGYSMNLVTPAFDVLMYSYLPFDEEPIGPTYFNANGFEVPDFKYPTEKFPITAEENYDDTKSSHPNISKRKGQVNKMMEKDPWTAGETSLLGEDRFLLIQKICRFEVIRSAIIIGDLTNALYSVRLLRKADPESYYLMNTEAKIWLTLAQCKAKGVSKPFESKKHTEGEIAVLHKMLCKFQKQELVSIALRQVYDFVQLNPNDQELKFMYNLMVETAAQTKFYELDRFSKYTYKQGKEKWKRYNDSILAISKDTTVVQQVQNTGSKYDRIKKKRNVDAKLDQSGFDSTLYYLYGLNDIVSNPEFVAKFNVAKSKSTNQESATNLTDEDNEDEHVVEIQPEAKKEEETTLLSHYRNSDKKFLLGEPYVSTNKSSPKAKNLAKSVEENFESLFVEAAKEQGLNVISEKLTDMSTVEGINNFAMIRTLLRQNSLYERIDFCPVDFEYFQQLKTNSGCNTAIIPNIYFERNKPGLYPLLFFWYFPPAGVTWTFANIMRMNTTYINFIEINLENGKASETETFEMTGKPTKLRLGALIYQIL